jgi:hypothetical protein
MKKNHPAPAVGILLAHIALGVFDILLFLFAIVIAYILLSFGSELPVVAISESILVVPLLFHAYFIKLASSLYAKRKYRLSLISHSLMYVLVIFSIISIQFIKFLPLILQFAGGTVFTILLLGYSLTLMRSLRKEASQFGSVKDKNEKINWQLWKNSFFKQFVFVVVQLFLGILDLSWVWFSFFGLAMLGGSPAPRESLIQSIILVLIFLFYIGYSVLLSIFFAVIGKRRWSLLAHAIPLFVFTFFYEVLKLLTPSQLKHFNPSLYFVVGIPITLLISVRAYVFVKTSRKPS